MGSIDNIKEKIKGAAELLERRDIFMALLVIGVAGASFGLGRLSGLQGGASAVRFANVAGAGEVVPNTSSATKASETGPDSSAPSANTSAANTSGQKVYVASKNGTKYHYTWCSGAQTISPANKIYFSTIEEARAAGYTPASNCKGLK